MSETVLDRLVACLRAALDATTRTSAYAPVALLWPDEGAQWEPIVRLGSRSACRSSRSATYEPEARRGPAYWIRCVVARTIDAGLPDGTADRVPAGRQPQ